MCDGKDITLRDYQYSSVRSAFDNQVGIVLLATSAGKCKDPDSYLYTNKGIKQIKDLLQETSVSSNDTQVRDVEYKGNYYLVNGLGELEKPSYIAINGYKDTFEIKDDLGHTTINTENHKLLTVDKFGDYVWKVTKDIS